MGIETRLGFQPLHKMPAFTAFHFPLGKLPNSSVISKQIICLPSGARVGLSEIKRTCAAIEYFLESKL
jgi:dTDP-4-amino-4,6-dideoxygalactose transaminase